MLGLAARCSGMVKLGETLAPLRPLAPTHLGHFPALATAAMLAPVQRAMMWTNAARELTAVTLWQPVLTRLVPTVAPVPTAITVRAVLATVSISTSAPLRPLP